MTEPVVFEPTMMKAQSDCAVACVRMLTGLPYEAVRAGVPRRYLRDLNNGVGLSNRQTANLSKRLGFPLRYVKGEDIPSIVGILDLHRPADPAKRRGKWEGHYVMVAHRVVYNPADGNVWTDLDSFLKTRRWEPVGVFVREDKNI